MKKGLRTILVLLSLISFFPVPATTAASYNDSNALQGLKTTKTLFDINLSEAGKLELYLGVIKKTQEDLIGQGITPDIILAFRGASVRLISTERWAFSEKEQNSLEKSSALLTELLNSGVRIEACAVATDLFKVDNGSLLPGIKVVGNTFVSLTGYQSKGYALIPIQ